MLSKNQKNKKFPFLRQHSIDKYIHGYLTFTTTKLGLLRNKVAKKYLLKLTCQESILPSYLDRSCKAV
jgi:hypothetical protein